MSTSSPTIDDFVHISIDVDVAAEAALAVKITPRHDTIGLDAQPKSTEFCTTVNARNLPEDDETARAPVDIVVALDVSGSMSGRKLELCKDTIQLLLRELNAQDRFGLVTFGDEANLAIPARKLTPENKEAAVLRVKRLHTSGCTNISGGIGLAAQELAAVESPHEVRTIFLLTDGLANRGISDRVGIVNLTKNCLSATAERNAIAMHCFGYGHDHDRAMLGDISNATEGGSYYFVDKDSDVSSAFGDALGGVLSVVAQNTFVNIKAATEGVSILKVKHDKTEKQLDGSYKVALGDFYAEESRDVLIETTLIGVPEGGNFSDVPHINVTVSYLDTINKKLVTSPGLIGSINRPKGETVSKTDKHVALQSIRLRTTKVISDAEALAESEELAKARSTINKLINYVQKEAKELEESTNPLVVQILSELNTMLAGLSSRSEYRTNGGRFMQTKAMAYRRQRCHESSEVVNSHFRSSTKSKMAFKMKKLSKK
jgi:Ca-activated chloride channel family protein